MGKVLTDGNIAELNNAMPANQNIQLGTLLDDALGKPFSVTVALTSAAAATAVPILTNAQVGSGKKVYIDQAYVYNSSTTAWTDTTATLIKIVDIAASPVVAVSVPKALLVSSCKVDGMTASTVTLAAGVYQGTGLTSGYGISVVGDANFAAGSTLYIKVTGVVK